LISFLSSNFGRTELGPSNSPPVLSFISPNHHIFLLKNGVNLPLCSRIQAYSQYFASSYYLHILIFSSTNLSARPILPRLQVCQPHPSSFRRPNVSRDLMFILVSPKKRMPMHILISDAFSSKMTPLGNLFLKIKGKMKCNS